ncbi:cytochrome P450 [Vararia minispora EC-137]|uniref:Cytochrome P450 n=1 Tax=Vararia minispora EC-137 TaxID=1314806 RepID=A0ACB8QJ03_9AGAM|nr:cytochrome P450 [Vararia minispora EC-137]
MKTCLVLSYTIQFAHTHATAIALLLAFVAASAAAAVPRRRTYPPGPRGLPLLGNTFQLPSSKHWLTYQKWAMSHGGVISFTSMGERLVVLNTARAVCDLFESRGAIYADRPVATMVGELVGWNKGLGYARLTPETSNISSVNELYPVHSHARFRVLRRLFQDVIGPSACQLSDHIERLERARDDLLGRITEKSHREPNGCNFSESVRQSTSAFILLLTYGYKVPQDSEDDELVRIVEDAMDGFSRASEPDAFLVDRWPILRYAPPWLPGTGFLREASRMHSDREKLYNVPIELAVGKAIPSMVSSLLAAASAQTIEQEEELIKAVGASLYSGSGFRYFECTHRALQTHSALMSFLLAMLLYPEVQTRAQVQLDSVLGSLEIARPLSLQDREHLPYVEALVKEVWRWNPSVPLGMAHRVTQDDIYDGMLLEKGTTVYANLWAILHDENIFPDPFSFSPERYISADGKLKQIDRMEDPSLIAFGFGRRICPGLHLADGSLFLYIASLLQFFVVKKALDEAGNELEPDVDYEGFISQPKPFKCRLVPRLRGVFAI